jgi:hypothetical protein
VSQPIITATVERNSKHRTIASSRLLDSLTSAHRAAWQAYFDLAPVAQEWVCAITMTFKVMNDGTTPIELEILLELESTGETGQWKAEKKFSLSQLSGKNQNFLPKAIQELLRKHVKEQGAAQCESMKQKAQAIEQAVEKLCPLTGLR